MTDNRRVRNWLNCKDATVSGSGVLVIIRPFEIACDTEARTY